MCLSKGVPCIHPYMTQHNITCHFKDRTFPFETVYSIRSVQMLKTIWRGYSFPRHNFPVCYHPAVAGSWQPFSPHYKFHGHHSLNCYRRMAGALGVKKITFLKSMGPNLYLVTFHSQRRSQGMMFIPRIRHKER